MEAEAGPGKKCGRWRASSTNCQELSVIVLWALKRQGVALRAAALPAASSSGKRRHARGGAAVSSLSPRCAPAAPLPAPPPPAPLP